MKKLLRYIACFMFSILMISCFMFKSNTASAVSSITLNEFSNEVNAILADYVKFNERLAGSDSEKDAAGFIKNYLDLNSNVSPKSNSYIEEGVQNFTFESIFSGEYESSQNIIYQYLSGEKNAKKVIIGCNYDALAYKMSENGEYDKAKTEGVNTSAATVATLLATTKFLQYDKIDFDIEFVFFGAGESNHAGSRIYTNGISDKDKEDILCMINFNNIALGNDLYFYINEIETETSKYVSNVAKEQSLAIEKVETVHLNKVLLDVPNELGLTYTHIAMQSDNLNFMKKGITTINIFAGDYDEGIVVGRCEFSGKESIAYTEDDNIEYITKHFGFEVVNQNMFDSFKAIDTILTDFDFQKTFASSAGETSWFYMIFGNEKLVVYLTVAAFLIFIVVAMFIHYKLSIKAYHANVEVEFLSSVVKISEEIDKTGVDSNVPKVVSQVLAHDIKKDKVIKRKRKKNNDE